MTNVAEWIRHAREDRWGILVDLVFAIVWVTMVDLLFRVLEGPDWAYYMFMLAGIVAYFGFFISLEMATANRE
ncbi:hypothetical protein [Natronorubrum daqingense]|uniref:DUF8119 domain-containing protein n=1 Tax=Natronorubrum daqingense TaxID=588898 RepID=A0A1N6Y6J1_9EURY|nr:hypothetical protein [Natronorubrum daqingense]APX95762.1 hypothetical protein BB347_03545 [Natronorubrum daqingense]SIR10187.1 hypothetical protein SAMN05421809_0334 [Natronorubrum daqingense]